MITFRKENDIQKIETYVQKNNGSYLQSPRWAQVKNTWTPYFYIGEENDEIILSAFILERKIPLVGKLWYLSCGNLSDYKNTELQKQFTDFIRKEMKKYGIFCLICDPLIPLRINGEIQEEGVFAHQLFTSMGYTVNTNLDSYTYKHPVQDMICLKKDGSFLTEDELLKSFEKGVRYSLRIANDRALVYKKYTYDDVVNDPSIMEDFVHIMTDTQDRNTFLARDGSYLSNLMKCFKKETNIIMVYYDGKLDDSLEEKRQNEKATKLEEIKTLKESQAKFVQKEIETLDKASASYHQRKEETKDQPTTIAVAAGLTIHYGNTATCLFGGTRNIIRNNTRSSHYLNYLRILDSLKDQMEYHDLGYVLVGNTTLSEEGYLNPMEPLDIFKGIASFKKSFGTKYYEFIGEYILVGNSFKYWLYRELLPKAKSTLVRLKRKKQAG